MAERKKKTKTQKIKQVISLLQVLVGIYGILFGISGISGHALFSIAHDWGEANQALILIISLLLLISGAAMVATLFTKKGTIIMKWAMDGVVGIWAVVIILLDFVGQIHSAARFSFITWLPTVLSHLIILTVLLLVRFEKR